MGTHSLLQRMLLRSAKRTVYRWGFEKKGNSNNFFLLWIKQHVMCVCVLLYVYLGY